MSIHRSQKTGAAFRHLFPFSLALLLGVSGAASAASVNTTGLAITDTTVTVGDLHSATGTMAISEIGSIQAEMLAIDQINAAGGVLGRKIEVIDRSHQGRRGQRLAYVCRKSPQAAGEGQGGDRVRLLDFSLAQGRIAGVRERKWPPLLSHLL